jgi:serine protease Do
MQRKMPTISSLIVLTAMLAPLSAADKAKEKTVAENKYDLDAIGIAKMLSRAYTQVAEKAIPAVVFIKVESQEPSHYTRPGDDFEDFFSDDFFQRFFQSPQRPRESQPRGRVRSGEGSGFIITNDGYIITNFHVVKDATKITVDLNESFDKNIPAQLIGADPETDIAIIKIQKENLPHLSFGDSNQLQIGEQVVAVGSPFGLEASVTKGVISQKSRNNLKITDREDFIQTDAAINPGNSGGPLLNLDGQVIGMNTAIVSRSGGHMGIGFAIPSAIIMAVSDQIIHQGEVTRGFLGIELQPIDQDMAEAFKLERPQGILVTQVVPGSAAAKSGLKTGDIILDLNKTPIKSMEGFRNDISLLAPATEVNLRVNRDGKIIQIPVVVGTREKPQVVMSSTAQKLGLQVDTLTPELATHSGYKNDEAGVIIRNVQQGSISQAAGIKKGWVIIAVNHQKVANVDEFNKAIEKSDGKHVLLLVNVKGTMRFFPIKLS